MDNIKITELFAGVGGFREGIQNSCEKNNVNEEIVFVSEWDKYAQKSYNAIYDQVPQGDITAIKEEEIPNHDILVGGFPCQAFSTAGKMKGFEDARGTLFFDVARIAHHKKPKVLFLENVKGLVGHDKGKTLDVIIKALNDIGYLVDYEVLNSKGYGVPHNRQRIFIIAIRDDLIKEENWIIKNENNIMNRAKKRQSSWVKQFNFNFPKPHDDSKRIKDILEDGVVDEKYFVAEDKKNNLLNCIKGNHGIDIDGRLTTMCVADKNISPNLDANYAFGIAVSKVSKNQHIRAHIICDSNGVPVKDYNPEMNSEYKLRRLTPLETWRLQGFKDENFFKAQSSGISDSQLYKQAGNAVSAPVIERIFDEIITLLKSTK